MIKAQKTVAYRYEIYPTEEQKKAIETNMAAYREVYNYFLTIDREATNKRKRHMNYPERLDVLKKLIVEKPWLKRADSRALRCAAKEINNRIYKFETSNVEYPQYKRVTDSVHRYRTAYSNGNIKITREYIQIPKVGKLSIVNPITSKSSYTEGTCDDKIAAATVVEQIEQNKTSYYIIFHLIEQ